MMKVLAIIILMACLSAKAKEDKNKFKSFFQIKDVIKDVKKDQLVTTLRTFVNCCDKRRLVGGQGHEKAIDFLYKMIQAADPKKTGMLEKHEFNPDFQAARKFYLDDFNTQIKPHFKPEDKEYIRYNKFTSHILQFISRLKGKKGTNLIWRKQGTLNPEEVMVVGAHWDSLTFNPKNNRIDEEGESPGADDNGTGVAATLELIKLLAEIDLPKTVEVVLFDFQQIAYLGAKAYLEKLKKEDKLAEKKVFLNLTMLGHDTKIFDKKNRLRNYKLYIAKPGKETHAQEKKLAQWLTGMGRKAAGSIRFDVEESGRELGNNVPFWQNKIPTLSFSQNWETDYNTKHRHRQSDFVETLNLRSFHYAFQFIAGAALAWNFDMTR